MCSANGDEHWTCLNENTIKVNTDAAIFESPKRYSWSFVASDHRGELIEARNKGVLGDVHPELAKAVGIQEALSWIKEQGKADVVVETDFLEAVQAIRSATSKLSYYGRVIQKCKALLDDLRSKNVVLKFVKRSSNNVAHFLARVGTLPGLNPPNSSTSMAIGFRWNVSP
ncbi:hypothetical protein AgCh_038806 [Apium graveolens]